MRAEWRVAGEPPYQTPKGKWHHTITDGRSAKPCHVTRDIAWGDVIPGSHYSREAAVRCAKQAVRQRNSVSDLLGSKTGESV